MKRCVCLKWHRKRHRNVNYENRDEKMKIFSIKCSSNGVSMHLICWSKISEHSSNNGELVSVSSFVSLDFRFIFVFLFCDFNSISIRLSFDMVCTYFPCLLPFFCISSPASELLMWTVPCMMRWHTHKRKKTLYINTVSVCGWMWSKCTRIIKVDLHCYL